MSFVIIISVAIILFATILCFSPKFDAFRKKFSKGIDFYLTLFATIIGVFLAIYFSNVIEERKNKTYVINMLKISKKSIDNTVEQNNSTIYVQYKNFELDSINVMINPLYLPEQIENKILNDNLIAQHISTSTYEELVSDLQFAKKMKYFFESRTYKESTRIAEHFNEQLKLMAGKIALEIDFQENRLNINDKKKRFVALKKLMDKNVEKIYSRTTDSLKNK